MKKPLLNLLLVFIAAGFGFYFSRSVWSAYREQRAAADESLRQMHDSEERRAGLLRQESRLKSPAGREEQARGLGWKKQGEEPLDGAPTPPAEPAPSEPR